MLFLWFIELIDRFSNFFYLLIDVIYGKSSLWPQACKFFVTTKFLHDKLSWINQHWVWNLQVEKDNDLFNKDWALKINSYFNDSCNSKCNAMSKTSRLWNKKKWRERDKSFFNYLVFSNLDQKLLVCEKGRNFMEFFLLLRFLIEINCKIPKIILELSLLMKNCSYLSISRRK